MELWLDYRWKIENNWSFVLHEAPFFSVLAASSAARLLRFYGMVMYVCVKNSFFTVINVIV